MPLSRYARFYRLGTAKVRSLIKHLTDLAAGR